MLLNYGENIMCVVLKVERHLPVTRISSVFREINYGSVTSSRDNNNECLEGASQEFDFTKQQET